MLKQKDFLHKLTLVLQFHGQRLGVMADRSPKCHPEIAGEGIEYLWGLATFWYRQSPIGGKCTKELFHKLVGEATGGSSVLNIERVCPCSKKQERT